MKTCSVCKKELPFDQFYWRSEQGSYRSDCKSCISSKASIRWRNDPDFRARGTARSAKHQRKTKYGINETDYKNLLETANNRCEICGTPKCATGYALSIDHCHTTGKVRGILCQACNTSLGSFRDDTDIMQRAIDYLKENR